MMSRMMSKIWRWFGCRRGRVVEAGRFGGRMDWEMLRETLKGAEGNAVFLAVGQVLEFQRWRCVEAVTDKANVGEAMAFEAGAAAGVADAMTMLLELAEGRCGDAEMRAWFERG
jgi:hypothetical protein